MADCITSKDNGLHLKQQEFIDASVQRHVWSLYSLPSLRAYGTLFDPNHIMVCKKGFIWVRHDEVRDLTVQMPSEVCNDATVELLLILLQGKHLRLRTANRANGGRVDVSERG